MSFVTRKGINKAVVLLKIIEDGRFARYSRRAKATKQMV